MPNLILRAPSVETDPRRRPFRGRWIGTRSANARRAAAPGDAPRATRPIARGALAALALALLTPAAAVADPGERWARTVSRAAESVVSLKLSYLRNFDDIEQGAGNATGFVVDAERGIVLTNRHVVGSGPIRVSATFQSQARVDAVPLYRDPVHDFAFLRYDPEALRHASPESLSLRPDKVATGLDIRVIGSDGGEQLSILPGTIARLDREVPSYGRYGYNDFNTFYLQAASGTSGGSSGSPVIDIDGDVVALNAAANTRTASSFFLPLPRVLHALERLREGREIERGGFQTVFEHRPFRELARLGLPAEVERRARAGGADTRGLLVVRQVVPGGVADGELDAGDILLAVDGAGVVDFIDLASVLDASVGERLSVEVVRQGERRTLEIEVADLHALTPSRFVELGDAVLQDMSIQHARAMNRPQRGVVVVRPGYFFERARVPEGAVVVELAGQETSDLDDLLDAVRAAGGAPRMSLRYVVPGREFTPEFAQLEIDERWFGHRACERVDDARFWNCERVELPSPVRDAAAFAPPRAVPGYGDALLDRVAPAMVRVDFHIPYAVDNVYARHFAGVGVVVDAAAGLVAVDRNTVPIGLGDAELTFFGSHPLEARVVFLHPRHNVALLAYEPARLGAARPEALALADVGTEPPETLAMIGMRADGTFRRTRIDKLAPLTIDFAPPGLARFQQSPLDVYGVADMPPSLGGPLVDESGTVHALYMSFAHEREREIRQREWAMPAQVVGEALALYRAGERYRSIDATLVYRPLAEARRYGLPDAWLARFEALDADARRVLGVRSIVPGTDAAERLAVGDMLLAIDGTPVSELFAVERLAQRERLTLTLLRDGEVLDVELRPSGDDGLGTERMVSWAGALFQAPHGDIARHKGVVVDGVYVADTLEGSPAMWDGLWRNRFVVAVDGEPVTSLDEFLAHVGAKAQDEITRLSTVSMSGRRGIVAVQPEYHFWPTFEVRRDADGWRRIDVLNGAGARAAAVDDRSGRRSE